MAENFFGITDTGKIRDNNEDAFIAEALAKGMVAACVIDGVGGYEGGEVAAAIARESILYHFKHLKGDPVTWMQEAIVSANEKIYREKQGNKKNRNMACVLTLALVDTPNNVFYYAHVGDTRLYLLRDRSLIKVTKDQSFVGFLEDTGRLTEGEAMAHPKRNEINKALGFDPFIPINSDYIEKGESPFLPGDTILLCSDGLTDMIGSSEITAILTSDKSLNQKGSELIDAANRAGGKDNITVVLVENARKPIPQKATKPVLVKKNEKAAAKEIPKEEGRVNIPSPAILSKRKSNKGAIVILSFLCLVFLSGLLWMYFNEKIALTSVQPGIPGEQNKGPEENKLQKAIDSLTTDTLVLSPALFGQPVYLPDSLRLVKDSLVIKGEGNVLMANDSLPGGPLPLYISSTCRYILLDSLTMQNIRLVFEGESSPALFYRNSKFINCFIQRAVATPDTLDNKIKSLFPANNDSSPKKPVIKYGNRI